MPHDQNRDRSLRQEQVRDPAAETSSKVAAQYGDQSLAGDTAEPVNPSGRQEGFLDRGGAELRIEEAGEGDTLPPPSAHRADTMVRAVSPEARVEMERGNDFRNEPTFTKGDNAPQTDRARYPYTVEQMDEFLSEAPRPIFPDTPGGDGATPLSADRNTFLREMGDRGRFPSQKETEKWARSVFNAFRQRALELNEDALLQELNSVVRFGEAPEVQVEEMMWGGDFLDRLSRLVSLAQGWPRQDFYQQVAEEAGETVDDPWVDAAVHSFLGTLKSFLGGDGARVGSLGELQEIWDRA
jgi:hypothetical protein